MSGTEQDGDRLSRAERAFADGDFATARRVARELLQGAAAVETPSRQAAERIVRATSVDRVQLAILLACLAFVAWTFYRYVLS